MFLCSHIPPLVHLQIALQLPLIHPVVDERVDHRIGHGQPVEAEIHVLHVLRGSHLVVVVGVDEEEVVGQPADGEDGHYGDEHTHHLPLRLHRLHLAIRVFADRTTAPQNSAHQGVADEHHYHGNAVGQYQDDQVVSIRGYTLLKIDIQNIVCIVL